ncbi:tripartite tricarboxylate transporter substrate binding protein [Roseococcus suduntuyensis]|uniref:Tripartite-type tricarboxylate transporter receptor subunit TctC n=1 Tax=Roseococcus suduntuyensis TaxID=455361 RepID=A0A840AIB0_9PROT|nr:tripartite tricarboxylate transporter substrate binding protein [Roseococcus suduntuyensis]MBB3900323.1 tripartite-type tricarboxylate transporter receptor subunit TctC [Roseococcus suduntuyensis]
MTTRRQLAGAGIGLLAAPAALRAQPAWPTEKPIQAIVPYPPGGGVDVMTRLVLPVVEKHLPGARFVVQNRAGAGGQIGFEASFNSAPDGYTIGAVAVPAINTIPRERAARYRPMDYTFLANVVDDPNTIFVPPNSPFRTLGDLVEAARARPGRINYGTTGVGSDDHILMLALQAQARLEPLEHVPFAGAAPLLAQVLGGHIEVGVGNVAEILGAMREGRVRALGQAAAERWSAAPDLPTFREQGFDLVAGSARGIIAPPGLPDAIRQRLEQGFRAALADPDFLRDAARASLPLRIAVGADYRQLVQEVDNRVQELWQIRPWGQ